MYNPPPADMHTRMRIHTRTHMHTPFVKTNSGTNNHIYLSILTNLPTHILEGLQWLWEKKKGKEQINLM